MYAIISANCRVKLEMLYPCLSLLITAIWTKSPTIPGSMGQWFQMTGGLGIIFFFLLCF